MDNPYQKVIDWLDSYIGRQWTCRTRPRSDYGLGSSTQRGWFADIKRDRELTPVRLPSIVVEWCSLTCVCDSCLRNDLRATRAPIGFLYTIKGI